VDMGLSGAVGSGLGGNALRLIVGVILGIVVFLSVARLVKMPELAEAVDMLKTVLRRSRRKESSAT